MRQPFLYRRASHSRQVASEAPRHRVCRCHRCAPDCCDARSLPVTCPQVRIYLRCYSPVSCCLAASDSPDSDRNWHVEAAGPGALVAQSPLFTLQPGAPVVVTAYLNAAPPAGEGSAPVAWVLRIWSRTEVQVRENTEPEDAIAKLISSFEESSAGRSKEAESARAAAIAAADEAIDSAAAAAELAEALALPDRKARIEAIKKAASAMPSSIETVNGDQGSSSLPVDTAQIQALQEAVALAVSENEAASKTAAENRENLKPQLAKWAGDLDGRATKTATSDIDKVVNSSFARRNAFRQAAAVYASHMTFLEQAMSQVPQCLVCAAAAVLTLCLDQVKLGRNPPTEEGGEETVSMANLDLVQELRAAALEGGDWSAAIAKVMIPLRAPVAFI